MDLLHLAKRLGVQHGPSIAKAKEYQRLSQLRLSGAGANKMSVEAHSVCCVELGCKYYHQPVDPSLCLKYSLCKTVVAYNKVLSSLQQALGLHALVTTKELAIQHGCIQANDMAKKVLSRFKEQMSGAEENNQGNSIPSADYIPPTLLHTRSVYPCVSFYLSCRHLKIVGVDKKRLMSSAQVSEKEFNNVIEAFRRAIPELRVPEVKKKAVSTAAAGGETKGKKRKKGAEEDGSRQDNSHNTSDETFPDEEAAENEEQFDEESGEEEDLDEEARETQIERRRKRREDTVEGGRSATKKRRTVAAASSSSVATDEDIATAVLRQSKLNFGSDADPSAGQLRADSGDEGETEL